VLIRISIYFQTSKIALPDSQDKLILYIIVLSKVKSGRENMNGETKRILSITKYGEYQKLRDEMIDLKITMKR